MEKVVKVKVYYLPELDTLDLWLDDPEKEEIAEPLGDNIVLKLDRKGEIIGVEIISLRNLIREDTAKLPKQVRSQVKETLKKIAISINKAIP